MNNLHRELAPVSEEAWEQIEEEVLRTFRRHLAGRRVVDVKGPEGPSLSAVGTGHLTAVEGPAGGVVARQREVSRLVELRRPFTLARAAVDDVERGSGDSDWQPAKDAAHDLAVAEDRAVLDGYPAAGIAGIIPTATNPPIVLPGDVRAYPDSISQALSSLRMAGVDGPYSVLLGAQAYTGVSETSDHGYPVIDHIRRLIDGDIVWAPALSGAVVLTTRGGDFELHLGQDLSIGYLGHTGSEVTLYLQESFTFLPLTGEAAVWLRPGQSPQ
ncbi:family 1 encapsulin nanocompartment shell protein [Nonomuraea soli]|uniref:Type 1 encapsulin shell protein n=1 Tax=Nonomuraea soli TaxID=1032476 RepID=A0A7W0HRB1_9ACTN|nr:family 1 encapsulin nanocompartment shell protein [Nonomuraea soli]MBA2892451.1 putative linocin/CFP29 family protein [Nonomuraea soli]